MNVEATLAMFLQQWPRLAVVVLLLCGAALVAQQVAPRLRSSGLASRRGWIAVGGLSVGLGLWSATFSGVHAVTDTLGIPPPSVAAALAALPATAVAMALALLAARGKRQHRRLAAAAGSVAAHMAAAGIWGYSLGVALPGRDALGFVALMAALVICVVGFLGQSDSHKRRGKRLTGSALPTRKDVLNAARLSAFLLPSVLALMLILSRGLQGEPVVAPARFGTDLLPGLMTTLMLGLVQLVLLLDRRLSERNRDLSAQLDSVSASLMLQPQADPLTGLPGRTAFEQALRSAVGEAQQQHARMALLLIGMDGFKAVNGSFGHADGDVALKAYARRLTESLAQCPVLQATGPHQVARIGGDEFAVLMKGNITRRNVSRAADKLLGYMGGVVQCGEREVTLTCSVGISLFPDHGSIESLMHHADAAMHAVKETGGATYMFYDARMKVDARERIELLRDLRRAIEARQLELFFQPKMDSEGQVTSAEALLRWQHPTRGSVSPEIFIPLAERYGLIGSLGNWVIETACHHARVWRDAGLRMRVAINLSGYQMRQDDLVDRITSALKQYGIKPERLTCEITESVAMEDTSVTQITFNRLGAAGIHLSIDDFGTGHSSLSYLRKLPATELKIDRSFVMDLDNASNAKAANDARAIVEAVIHMARAIGLKVVAEGVETDRQFKILRTLGCHEFQGYLFARPMSARALLMWATDDRQRHVAFRESLFAPSQAVPDPNSVQMLRPPTVAEVSSLDHDVAQSEALFGNPAPYTGRLPTMGT